MPSADLLGAVERASPWPKRVALATTALAVAAVGAATAAALNSDARAYVRLGLQRLHVVAAERASGTQLAVAPAAVALGAKEAGAAARAHGEKTVGENTEAGDADAGSADADAAAPAQQGDAQPRSAQVRSRKLVEWLSEIASSSGRGLILAPEVGGDATALFDRATGWQERLAALARIHGFQYSVSERLIEVWVRPREVAVAHAAEVASAGSEGKELQATASRDGEHTAPHASSEVTAIEAAAAEPPVALIVRPTHARAADLASAVSKAARAGHVEVAPDPSSNSVVIAGAEQAVSEIADLVRALDVPRRRFVLEAEIVELSSTARQELGVRWSVDGTVGALVDFPAADAPGEGAGVIIATDGAHALRARINALAADGHARVVSRPRVVVLEGRPASIESVRILRVRYPSSAVVGDIKDGAAAAAGRAFEEIPVGVVLRVEPSMQGDGRIVLRIRAKSSTLGPPQPPDDIPEELSRMVDAEVAVGDGETAVLGGLLREGSSEAAAGVPGLRSVPVLGALFGKRNRQDEDEELVVFVTPRLIRS